MKQVSIYDSYFTNVIIILKLKYFFEIIFFGLPVTFASLGEGGTFSTELQSKTRL